MTISTGVDLSIHDFKKLVCGAAVVKTFAGLRIRITARSLSAKGMLGALATTMNELAATLGDDPVITEELHRPRRK